MLNIILRKLPSHHGEISVMQFYPELQNFMTTHIEENIFEHFKTTGTDMLLS